MRPAGWFEERERVRYNFKVTKFKLKFGYDVYEMRPAGWFEERERVERIAFENHPPPSVPAIHKIVKKFRTDACINSRHSKRRRVVAEEQGAQEILICASVEEHSSLISRQIAAMLGISRKS
ncbi:hypothetical protein QE152_g27463 [Popillia japonica]|uniref:DUF4817 domain-containing protein n=1 Tax=Popillia japonica TaxID=7064 RepID=A0AAW1JSH4_POPJA